MSEDELLVDFPDLTPHIRAARDFSDYHKLQFDSDPQLKLLLENLHRLVARLAEAFPKALLLSQPDPIWYAAKQGFAIVSKG